MQGVDLPKRFASKGAAIWRVLLIALSRFSTILLIPTTIITCLGPYSIGATRLPLPSMLKIFPSRVMALVPVINVSTLKFFIYKSRFSSFDKAGLNLSKNL
ncbi:hypothetical protein D3C76_1596380 [compost metagenome]